MVAINGGPFLISDESAHHELGHAPVNSCTAAFAALTR
jgi:hypothetical protein